MLSCCTDEPLTRFLRLSGAGQLLGLSRQRYSIGEGRGGKGAWDTRPHMYRSMRVFDYLGVRDVRFAGLGHINVVAGRNNSGKTTLLQAIWGQPRKNGAPVNDNVEAIVSLTEDDVDRLVRKMQGKLAPQRIDEIRERLKAEIVPRNPWSSSERDEFAESVMESLRELNVPLAEETVTALAGVCRRHLIDALPEVADRTRVLYIPPKRALETRGKPALGQGARSDGPFVLAHLFSAKNQPPGSPLREAFASIERAFEEITDGMRFDISMAKNGELALQFSANGSDWVHADASGLGFQDLLVFLYFLTSGDYSVLLIEEPEAHLNPALQRKLLAFMASRKDKQVFLTTHSNVFLDNTFVDRVFFVTYEDGEVRVRDATSRAFILDDLGYDVADNLVSDLVVLVEGPTDIPVYRELLRKRGVLERAQIRFWPLGGDIMSQLDLTVFTEWNQLIAVVDGDPGSNRARSRFVARCEELGIPVHRLERRSIENYFSLDALKQVYGEKALSGLTSLDPTATLSDQLKFEVKKKNREIARALRLDDVYGTDLAKVLVDLERRAAGSLQEAALSSPNLT